MSHMLNKFRGRATDPAWAELDATCDTWGLPRQWIVCPHCGQQSWRLPPHGFEPCPIVAAMAELGGMKLEADRSTSIRAGVQMEEMTRALRLMVEDEEDEE